MNNFERRYVVTINDHTTYRVYIQKNIIYTDPYNSFLRSYLEFNLNIIYNEAMLGKLIEKYVMDGRIY